MSFLLDDLDNVSTARRALHEDCLQRLMKIGPLYPTEFRTIMTGQSILKSKLENAIKLSQTMKQSSVTTPAMKKAAVSTIKPSIKLKTSFNFSG